MIGLQAFSAMFKDQVPPEARPAVISYAMSLVAADELRKHANAAGASPAVLTAVAGASPLLGAQIAKMLDPD